MNKLFLVAGICFLMSCSKKGVVPPVPNIVVNTPSENQHYVKGDTIRITGTVTHSADILEVAVHMTNNTTNVEFFHNHFSAGNLRLYNFNSVYGIADNIKATYTVEVEANDIDGNTSTKEITISVN
jgi:hypothetical protein